MLALTFIPDNIDGVFSDLAKHIGDLLITGQGSGRKLSLLSGSLS